VLWRELQPRLLRYLRVHSADGCEDIAAETWLQIVRDLPSFIGTADGFRGWLFTIARHRAIDAARARAARPSHPVADISLVARPTSAPSAEHQALEQISTDAAIALVASLPAEQAEMVALRVIAGLDVSAVAEIVGKSSGAVRVSVHRGLRALSRDPDAQRAEVV
jgi:RNA polymerase sigma-70 factor (ECF subfamily)